MTVMLDTVMLGDFRSQQRLSQVERQIDQMVKFIKQEAEEKANEISVSAEEVHRLAVLCHALQPRWCSIEQCLHA